MRPLRGLQETRVPCAHGPAGRVCSGWEALSSGDAVPMVSPWHGPGGRGPPVCPLPAWPRRLFPRRGAGEAVITGIYR